MSFAKAFGGVSAALLVSALSSPVFAGPSEALAGCKAEIAGDAQLSGYETVHQNTKNIKRRGRFTNFEIKVNAETADGVESSWVATCKARSNGQVEELQLVSVGGAADAQVAQSGK